MNDVVIVEEFELVITEYQQGLTGGQGPTGPAAEGLDPNHQDALDAAEAPSAENPFVTVSALSGKENSGVAAELFAPLLTSQSDSKDPTGFVSPELITVAGIGVARTVSLTGTLDYQWRGTRHSPVSPWIPGDAQHPDTDGPHFLYSTDGVTFAWSAQVWPFDAIMVARHQRVGGVNYYWRECHGLMPWQAHREAHEHPALGAYRQSGGSVVAGTYALDSDGDAAVTPQFAAAILADEDLHTAIPSVDAGAYCHLYFAGNRVLTLSPLQALPYRVGGTYPLINASSGGNFADAETLTGRWFNVYQILSPAAADATSQKIRMQFLQPQVAYTSIAAAQAEIPFVLDTLGIGAFGTEQAVVTRLTYRTNAAYAATGKVRLVAVGEVTGKLNISGVGGSATTAENVTTTPFEDITATNQQATNEELGAKRLRTTANIYAEQGASFTILAEMLGKDVPVDIISGIITLPAWDGAGFGNGFQCKIVNLNSTTITYSGTVVASGTKQPAYSTRILQIIGGTWYIGGLTT